MNHHKVAIVILGVSDVTLFLLSGIPRLKNATHGAALILGDLVWFGFLLGLLALIVIAIMSLARGVNRRKHAAR